MQCAMAAIGKETGTPVAVGKEIATPVVVKPSEALRKLENVQEQTSILEIVRNILYYPENLVITVIQKLEFEIFKQVELLDHLKKEIIWIQIEDCDYQCASFGLNNELASNLASLDEFALQHEDLIYFFSTWLEINWIEITSASDADLFNHETNFIQLGIDPDVSKIIHARLDKKMMGMQNSLYWAKYHIKTYLYSHIFISQGQYVLLPSNFDTWIPSNAVINNRNLYFQTIDVLQNIELYKASSTRKMTEVLLTQKFGNNKNQLYFHGTTLHCLNGSDDGILCRGIDLGRGSPKQDFSHKFGFYLSESLDAAIEWGRVKNCNDHCVIIFSIPIELLDAQSQGGLDVLSNFDLFCKVSNYFLSEIPKSNFSEFSPSELEEINKAKFIRGNVWDKKAKQIYSINSFSPN